MNRGALLIRAKCMIDKCTTCTQHVSFCAILSLSIFRRSSNAAHVSRKRRLISDDICNNPLCSRKSGASPAFSTPTTQRRATTTGHAFSRSTSVPCTWYPATSTGLADDWSTPADQPHSTTWLQTRPACTRAQRYVSRARVSRRVPRTPDRQASAFHYYSEETTATH